MKHGRAKRSVGRSGMYDRSLDLSSDGRFSRYEDDLPVTSKRLLLAKCSSAASSKPDLSDSPVPASYSVILLSLPPLGVPGVVVVLGVKSAIMGRLIHDTRKINEKMGGMVSEM